MISTATYKNGIAINSQGATYISGLASSALPAATAIACKGSDVPPAKILDSDGAVYVRFV